MTSEIKQRIEQIRNGEVPKGYKHSKVCIIPEDWEVLRLKDKFDRLSRKNSEGNTNVLTISAQYGLINQEEFFKKEIASDDKSNYYLLHRGEFAYNKSYSNGYPFGAIKRLSRYDKGVVSPLYICFSANNNNACPEYYEQYFEAGRLNHEIQAYAQEGARNHGLLNISVIDFFNSLITVPPIEEQKRIAKILSAQDKVIECYEKKIEQLNLMKKYYLQNMFPKRGETVPKIRFKGFTDPWEQRKLSELGEIVTGSTPSTTKSEYYSEDGLPWVTPSDIESNIISNSPRKLSDEGARVARVVPANTILCTCIASIGKNALLTVKGSFNQQINSLTPNEENDPYFLLTESEFWSNHMKQLAASGTMQIINKTEFSELPTMIPKYEEQKIIGEYFKCIDTLIALHQRKLEEEKKKKKALQQLLLTGIVRTN